MAQQPDPKPGKRSAFELLRDEVRATLARQGAAYAVAVSLELLDREAIDLDQFVRNMRQIVDLSGIVVAPGVGGAA